MIETIGLGVVLPAAVSATVFFAIRRFTAAESAHRYAATAAFACGFGIAYALQVPWAQLSPTRHWHWIAYLGLVASVVGPIAAGGGLLRFERWLLQALMCFLAASLLVPHWPDLSPPRIVSIPLLAAYLFLLSALLELLSLRMSGATICAAFAFAAAGVAALIAACVSLTYASLAGIAAAALMGCCVAAIFSRDPVRGLSLPFAVIVGGWAYTGCIDPQQPLIGILIAVAAPLGLWWRSVMRETPSRTAIVFLIDAAAVAFILALASAYAF